MQSLRLQAIFINLPLSPVQPERSKFSLRPPWMSWIHPPDSTLSLNGKAEQIDVLSTIRASLYKSVHWSLRLKRNNKRNSLSHHRCATFEKGQSSEDDSVCGVSTRSNVRASICKVSRDQAAANFSNAYPACLITETGWWKDKNERACSSRRKRWKTLKKHSYSPSAEWMNVGGS